MDRTIEIKVNGSYLTKDNRVGGVQHEANATTMRIEFDGGWDGYAKKVTFWDAKGLNPVERTLTTDLLEDITVSTRIYLCQIPGEALAECGECTFVIDGYVSGKRQRSISDTLLVREAPFIEQADQPSDPTPTQAEQLQAEIDSIQETIQSAATSAESAQAAKTEAEAAKKSAESAATSALSYKTAAYSSAVLAGQERGAAEQAKVNAEAAQGKAEAAKEAAETAQAAAESAGDTAVNAMDSAKESAALAMGYAIGTVSNPFSFTVPANSSEDYVVLSDADSPAILEDGKKYRITVNREIAYATASGRSISALGVTITGSSSSYHVENQNDYDVTGSFGEAATQTIGKSAAEYADEASRAAAVASGAETTATEQAALARASETAAKASETAAAASAKAAAASAARAEEIAGGDFATKTELGAHTGNADIHVTAEEKAAWNESDVFIAVYEETTASEIIEAFNAGKFVVCKKSKQFGLLENVVSTNIVRFKVLNNGADYSADYSTVLAEYPVCTTWLVSGSTWTANNISGSHLHASTHSSGGSDPITPESIGAAEIPKCVSVTLSASGWDSTTKTKTVTVTGVSATETDQLITPVPALASQAAYYDTGIKCTGQAANSLTFTADTIPTADLTVYVTIQEVSA